MDVGFDGEAGGFASVDVMGVCWCFSYVLVVLNFSDLETRAEVFSKASEEWNQ